MASSTDARSTGSGSAPIRTIGKYRIDRVLGAGGMGTVYLAVDTELRRTVALKVLSTDKAANPQLVRRFKSEGQAAARLEHENIVKVFEAGEINGQLFLALEYIDGIDVQELVSKRGRLPVRRSIEIVSQVAAALQHAYERGIVHRDIKPSNLLIRKDGHVKLADMGLARAIDETLEAGITHAGMTVGTVDYISPEQGSDSKRADIRSDLYSLGCSWFHMLTGEVPYSEGTAVDRLRAHATAIIPDPRRLNDRIPAAVVAVMQRLLAKRPEARYQTPQELLDDLRQPSLLHHETGAADIAGLALADTESPPQSLADSDDSLPTASPVDDRPRGKSRTKPARRAAQDGRDPTETSSESSADSEDSTPAVSQVNERLRGKSRAKPAGRARRHEPDTTSEAPSRTEANSKPRPGSRQKPDTRELPPRSERPEQFAVTQRGIDPDTLKLIAGGLLVFGIVAAIGWAAWRAAQDSGPPLQPQGVNPFAGAAAAPAAAPPTPVTSSPPKNDAPQPPENTLTTFRPDDPFPGTAKTTGETEVVDVPKWVYEARAYDPPQPKTITVDPATAGAPVSIENALSGLPASGGIVELRGRGPHQIRGLTTIDGRDVLILAATGESPVVQLLDGPDVGGFSTRGGRLELNGLHVVASGRSRDATQPLIRAESATIVIRNASITLTDPADSPVAAVQLDRGVSGPARCVLENVVVRGNNLIAVATSGAANEVVAGNCLFAAGNAPAIFIRDPLAIGQDSAASQTGVQLLSCILVSRNAAAECEQRESTVPPALYVRLRRTALLGEGPGAAALRFSAWPETNSSELDRPRALGVQLVSEQSVWAGWPHLTAFRSQSGSETLLGDSEAEWLQFWRTPLGNGSVIAPQPVNILSDHSRLDPATVVMAVTSSSSGTDTSSHTLLDHAQWPAPPQSLIERLAAASARPRVPADLDAAFAGPTITIDLAKFGIKLNQKLNEDCPDGAHVVLTGKKRALIEPVVLKGKSLRIEIDGGGELLQLEPATRAGGRPPALFRVEGGRLDLVNARVRIPSSESASQPLRLLQAVDGSFAIRNCVLIGQMGAGAQELPFVEWSPGTDAAQFGLIENSLIAGRSQVIGAQLQGQSLEVRNSILVGAGDGLRISSAAASPPGTVNLAHSTVSVAGAYFYIESPAAPATTGQLQVFVDDSVYYPPMSESVSPVLLVEDSHGGPPLHVDWWEERTALSNRITRFRVPDLARTEPQNVDDVWQHGWGPDHMQHLITGPLSVIPSTQKVDLAKVQPGDFRLGEKSQAAAGGGDGGALGADVDAVGPREVKADATTKPATKPTQPPTPRGGQPNF